MEAEMGLLSRWKTRAFYAVCFTLTVSFFVAGTVARGAIETASLHSFYNQTEVDAVELGHEFLVLVKIQPAPGATDMLYGASLDVVYDPAFLQIIDVDPITTKIDPKMTEGAFLSQDGSAETLLIGALVNDQPGRLTVGLVRKGAVAGVLVEETGEVLLSVHFRSVKMTVQGEPTTIRFGMTGLKDANHQSIEIADRQADSIDIVQLVVRRLDLNDDNAIDLKDLILAMQIQADEPTTVQVHPEADFSGDGILGMAEAAGIIQVLAEIRNPPE